MGCLLIVVGPSHTTADASSKVSFHLLGSNKFPEHKKINIVNKYATYAEIVIQLTFLKHSIVTLS